MPCSIYVKVLVYKTLHKILIHFLQCSDAYAIKALFEHLSDPRTFIALFGPGCALATEPVASVARFWNLIQVNSLNEFLNTNTFYEVELTHN